MKLIMSQTSFHIFCMLQTVTPNRNWGQVVKISKHMGKYKYNHVLEKGLISLKHKTAQ